MSTPTPPTATTSTRRPKKDWREIRENASMASVGLEMGLSIMAGWYLGHLFDGHFETAPWGQVFFVAGGIGAAGKAVWRAVKHAKKVMSRPEPGQVQADKMTAATTVAGLHEGASR